MTMAEGDGAGHLFSVGQLTETDWQALAPAAGGVGRFAMDLDLGEAEIDLTFRRLTGLIALPRTFAAADFIAYIHEADRAIVADAIETARNTGEPYDVTYRFVRPTGETIWLRAAGRPVATPDGRNLLIGVATDITEERAAQERAELLAGEMSHRIKNVFTLIQSMFNMAARTA
ncbi:MAG: PAS domain-containing protein, partial [Pseudomonadota bacterium]